MKLINYLKQRLEEKGTWAGISTAIASAALLTAPYSYAFIAAGVIMALAPTP
jgi:hypothetical protein